MVKLFLCLCLLGCLLMPDDSQLGTVSNSSDEPLHGLYGTVLDTRGDSTREPTPDGGHIIWQKYPGKGGKDDWRPIQYLPPDNKIQT